MNATPRLTAEYLRHLGLGNEISTKFEFFFPDGMTPTSPHIRLAIVSDVNVPWICARLSRPLLWFDRERTKNEWSAAISCATWLESECGKEKADALRSAPDYQRAHDKWLQASNAWDAVVSTWIAATPLACARLIRNHLRQVVPR